MGPLGTTIVLAIQYTAMLLGAQANSPKQEIAREVPTKPSSHRGNAPAW
jgi:hypothetical protein